MAVIAWAWVFRDVLFRGELLGNVGDARWTIAVHEHWFRVWQGLDSVRDLQYFFPLQRTLGTSDAFLVQGQLYSAARLLGFDFIDSWVSAQLLFYLVGAVGVAFVARRVLASVWSQLAATLLTCASYPMVVGVGHVQLIGFLAFSWVVVGVLDLFQGKTRRGVALIAIVPPLLALSSWYAMVLGAMTVAFLAVFGASVAAPAACVARCRQICSEVWSTLRSVRGAAVVALFVLGWSAVLWVYLPSRNLLPAAEWFEVAIYSPRWSDLLNASEGGGGIWLPVYDRLFEPDSANYEQRRGFTPILFAALAAFGLLQIRRPQGETETTADRYPGRLALVATWLTVLAVALFFVVDERLLGVYRVVWETVPGFDSIRAPFRIQALSYALAIFVVLRSMELWWARAFTPQVARWRRVPAAALSASLIAVIMLEMLRPTTADWTRSEFLPPALLAQVPVVQERCDAVIAPPTNPGEPPWVAAVDAVIFSVASGVPTPQGYGRGVPLGYPGVSAGGTALAAWMRAQGFDGRVCLVTPESVEYLPG